LASANGPAENKKLALAEAGALVSAKAGLCSFLYPLTEVNGNEKEAHSFSNRF
jgi:hypothetical protein